MSVAAVSKLIFWLALIAIFLRPSQLMGANMIDRVIGIIGLALSLIGLCWNFAPADWPKIPPWLVVTGGALGVFLVGLALGMMLAGERSEAPSMPAPIETGLVLQFSDTNQVPVGKAVHNIRHWYALYTSSVYVDTLDDGGKSLGNLSIPPLWAVFVIFEKPPIIRQLVANCKGPNNPRYDVREANSTYAVITIEGDVTNTILDITILTN